jgi:hypothetical protein
MDGFGIPLICHLDIVLKTNSAIIWNNSFLFGFDFYFGPKYGCVFVKKTYPA